MGNLYNMSYEYANYSLLSADQKCLWWFDEYLRYDLVLSFLTHTAEYAGNRLTFLIERHSVYNYPSADNYSYYLFNLCNTTDILYNVLDFNIRWQYRLKWESLEVVIPEGKGRFVITYYSEANSHISPLGRIGFTKDIYEDDEIDIDRARDDYITYVKRVLIISLKDIPQKIKLSPNIVSYSVVISELPLEDTIYTISSSDLESLFDFYLLYKNIESWQTILNAATNLTIIDSESYNYTIHQGDYIDYKYGSNLVFEVIDPPSNVSYEVWLTMNAFNPPNSGDKVWKEINYTQGLSSHLIYAKPLNLFNGLYNSAIDTLPSNISIGVSINYENLLALFLGNTFFNNTSISNGGTYSTILNTFDVSFTVSNEKSYNYGTIAGSGINDPDDYLNIDGELWSVKKQEAIQHNLENGFNTGNIGDPPPTRPFNGIFKSFAQTIFGGRVTRDVTWGGGSPLYEVTELFYDVDWEWEYGDAPQRHIQYNIENFTLPSIEDAVDEINYLLNTGEYIMALEQKIDEIHACLGAAEFAYYSNGGSPQPYQMHIARTLDFLAKSFGIYYNPDGTLQSVLLNPSPPPELPSED